MVSSALSTWEAESSRRLDELVRIHRRATGPRPGRRWETDQLNKSLLVALVARFQAFARDLHDAAVDVHVGFARVEQQSILRLLLTRDRKLDVGNPRPSALGADFGRLGFPLIQLLNQRPNGAKLLSGLEQLVDYRNAIAHADDGAMLRIERAGAVRATKTSFTSNRRALNLLARTMDEEVAAQLMSLLNIASPW